MTIKIKKDWRIKLKFLWFGIMVGALADYIISTDMNTSKIIFSGIYFLIMIYLISEFFELKKEIEK